MNNWMKKLAVHYEKIREKYPLEKLAIVFDIDGTIIDLRHMIHYVLRSYDYKHNTSHFKDLRVCDINVNENKVPGILLKLGIGEDESKKILTWYMDNRWSKKAVFESHRPFQGVMEVIRWFQIQPNTYVVLNTGRPEEVRKKTLQSLNKLGKEYKVRFKNEFLYMNPHDWNTKCTGIKAQGVQKLMNEGYKVFAFVDNEPENLRSVATVDENNDMLLLHASTIFESKSALLPSSSVSGEKYDLTELIEEESLPNHVQFVWHGIGDRVSFDEFLSEDIQWGECDVRFSPDHKTLIARNESFLRSRPRCNEKLLTLNNVLKTIQAAGKSIKLDLKKDGKMINALIDEIEKSGISKDRIWFNGTVETLKEKGFRKLAEKYPNAIIQCPIDFLFPLIVSAPEAAKNILNMFSSWGVTRFSVNWRTPNKTKMIGQLQRWGFHVNIYNIPDLQSFLKAVLFLPKSITSDFNFPKWKYFGKRKEEDLDYLLNYLHGAV